MGRHKRIRNEIMARMGHKSNFFDIIQAGLEKIDWKGIYGHIIMAEALKGTFEAWSTHIEAQKK